MGVAACGSSTDQSMRTDIVMSSMGHPQFNAVGNSEQDGLKVITTTIDCEGMAVRICLDYVQNILILAIQMSEQ